MGLLGAIFGGGYRPPPPPPPPPTDTTGEANGTNTADTNGSQTTGAGSSQSSGEGASAQTTASAGRTPTGETTGTPGATRPTPNGSSDGTSQAAVGTPVDASQTRADFSLLAKAPDEGSARAYAVAAESRERVQTLVDGLAAGPQAAPTLSVAPAEKPEPVTAAGAGINATLPTLRGQNAPGAVLDKVA